MPTSPGRALAAAAAARPRRLRHHRARRRRVRQGDRRRPITLTDAAARRSRSTARPAASSAPSGTSSRRSSRSAWSRSASPTSRATRRGTRPRRSPRTSRTSARAASPASTPSPPCSPTSSSPPPTSPTRPSTQLRKVAPVSWCARPTPADSIGQMRRQPRPHRGGHRHRRQGDERDRRLRRQASPTGKKKLAAAGLDGTEFAFADGWQRGQPGLHPPVRQGLAARRRQRASSAWQNAWKLEGDEAYGLGDHRRRGPDRSSATCSSPTSPTTPTAATRSPTGSRTTRCGSRCRSCKKDQVHRLPDGIWMFGGPASMRAVHRRARRRADA